MKMKLEDRGLSNMVVSLHASLTKFLYSLAFTAIIEFN